METRKRRTIDELTSLIIAAANEVHRELGPGLLESICEQCLIQELKDRGLIVESQLTVPVSYKGKPLGATMRLDILVEGRVIVEVKTVDQFHEAHVAQLLTYLKLTDRKVGLLINFNDALLKHGIRRVVNGDITQA
ncbi:MAG: GxxExxY protein [Flavobacteriales bacterium]|nr:MAG: GxxExxY protein [Flavobacteriales bacterium]